MESSFLFFLLTLFGELLLDLLKFLVHKLYGVFLGFADEAMDLSVIMVHPIHQIFLH